MRKIKFILLMLIVLSSFVVLKALGEGVGNSLVLKAVEGNSDQLTASVGDSVKQLQNNNADLSEVYSQNVISTSSLSKINNSGCDLNVSAQLGLVRPFGQNYSLVEFNADNHWPIASITKLMTAMIVYENMNLEKNITFTSSSASVDGVTGDFKVGETFKISDLISSMLIFSSNRAAEALSQDFGRDKFMDLMNKKAKELSMMDTNFYDPTGLSMNNQSTPNDIFKLVSYIYNVHPEILKITRQIKTYITEINSRKRRTILNINEFVGTANFIGGKTGFIEESKGNLVSVFNVDNQLIITVVLGSQNRFGETKKLLECAQ
ncbi:hypothetical protein COV23_01320 [Candidatus Wolfebacteria bacterium CG10_big_fil_rev_8_21_14_0_10_31_9]|uniref:Peptidase S11 D-alanyl-D-alanine carboxypeptidase A N-terminal domain-containing protein n=1 Tax=Candidatus Wolfebacteria bacterium CG10_big_fil_rev_8_21_14_0_10_31_9 TaxID=1975070 RepID=A0A2H0RCH5_9BACT|nr:MAG: hypothetical protein COV23_01320 [Candidatus Wolfebacteria bacterium CG10_big_fil_rev_8_21_14_0_10_31_9]